MAIFVLYVSSLVCFFVLYYLYVSCLASSELPLLAVQSFLAPCCLSVLGMNMQSYVIEVKLLSA